MDMENARIVLVGGRGLGEEEASLLYQIAELTGASVAATRAAVEKGLFRVEQMVGLSGCSIYPQLYVSFGSSGSNFHRMGIKSSCTIVAVNTDLNAKIMEIADFAIALDCHFVLTYMLHKLQYETISEDHVIGILLKIFEEIICEQRRQNAMAVQDERMMESMVEQIEYDLRNILLWKKE